MPNDPSQRFLLLAYDRSGSTLLVNYLNSHPSVQCFHEPFNRRIWKDIVRHYGSIPNAINAHYDRERIAENLRVREIAAKRSTLSKKLLFSAERLQQRFRPSPRGPAETNSRVKADNASAVAAVGFKVTTTQVFKAIPDLWCQIRADLPDKVIVLSRSGLIDRFLSCQYALKTGVWRSNVPLQRNDSPIAVDFDRFCAFVDEEQGFDARIQEDIGSAGAQCLRITYEELVESRDSTLDKVFAFLDQQAPEELDGKLAKLSRGSAESRIANYAELTEMAAGTPYERHLP